jgi:hypothetical protein
MKPSLRSERGAGTLKTIIVLLIVGAIFSLIWQIVPAYYERYDVGLAMNQALEESSLLMNDPQVEAVILQALKDRKLYPAHQASGFKVERRFDPESGKDRIFLKYAFTREIGLPGTGLSHPLVFTLQR